MNFRLLLLCSICAVAPLAAQTYNFSFANVPGAQVAFTGSSDSFVFNPEGSGFDFQIGSSDFGDLDGFFGNISGLFSIGSISSGPAFYEFAPVTGVGAFSITDSLGYTLSADFEWQDIFTIDLGSSFGGLNTMGSVNLMNFAGYTGSNARLLSLLGADGAVSVSFQFANGKSLTELTQDGASYTTSYSGSVAVVPEASGGLLIGLLATAIGPLMWLRRAVRGGHSAV